MSERPANGRQICPKRQGGAGIWGFCCISTHQWSRCLASFCPGCLQGPWPFFSTIAPHLASLASPEPSFKMPYRWQGLLEQQDFEAPLGRFVGWSRQASHWTCYESLSWPMRWLRSKSAASGNLDPNFWQSGDLFGYISLRSWAQNCWPTRQASCLFRAQFRISFEQSAHWFVAAWMSHSHTLACEIRSSHRCGGTMSHRRAY